MNSVKINIDGSIIEAENGITVLEAALGQRGSVRIKDMITDVTPRGTVYMTFHFADTPSNLLIGQSRDSVTLTPAYKSCAVAVEKNGRMGIE